MYECSWSYFMFFLVVCVGKFQLQVWQRSTFCWTACDHVEVVVSERSSRSYNWRKQKQTIGWDRQYQVDVTPKGRVVTGPYWNHASTYETIFRIADGHWDMMKLTASWCILDHERVCPNEIIFFLTFRWKIVTYDYDNKMISIFHGTVDVHFTH